MIACSSFSARSKNVCRLTEQARRQLKSSAYGVRPTTACFHSYNRHTREMYIDLNASEKSSCLSISGFRGSQGGCFGSGFSTSRRIMRSITTNLGSRKRSGKEHFEISLSSQNTNVRLLLPKQGTNVRCSIRRLPNQRRYASAGLIVGLLVCCSSLDPVHAEAANAKDNRVNDRNESYVKSVHGKNVYTDYSITGIPGDGRCLFRSVAHGACLRSGKPAPNESLQKELADELRNLVADEFIRRREETEWFIEGDFGTYISQMRKPHVWGGEPELLMASHVLRMPIKVYMYDNEAGGVISIAEYGQEYGKENPIRVLYHGFGHYDALQIPGNKGYRSKL